MTRLIFREDAYCRSHAAKVVAVTAGEKPSVELDATIFYAQGGGQPGDVGILRLPSGEPLPIVNTVYGPDKSSVLHLLEPHANLPDIGASVEAELDWARRYARMRVHTALHLLTAVLPYPVTGGAIGDGEGRLDFDIPDAGLDKAEITEKLQALIDRRAPVRESWITDAELLANPGLIKTMSVKPPMGAGRVRLIEIEGIDLQPCGGTHVANTGEIGRVAITDIEKKGKQNRRIRLALP